jgi:hypothetical protein
MYFAERSGLAAVLEFITFMPELKPIKLPVMNI